MSFENVILSDDLGLPSVMVRIPRFNWSDVYDGGEDSVFPAFIVGGKAVDCIYISKYLNVIEYDRAYSLPLRDPAHSINYDEARAACARKGRGWHLLTNVEWMALAHWCRKNGILPHGNTKAGCDVRHPEEKGTLLPVGFPNIPPEGRTLTGSGPASWTHDGTSDGIHDLVGNVWDMVAGLRIVDGEIQIIPDNDSALNIDESAASPYWRGITPAGELVSPGGDTYKYDGERDGSDAKTSAIVPTGVRLNTRIEHWQYTGPERDGDYGYTCMPISQLGCAEGLSAHPLLIKLGLYPPEGHESQELIFARNNGERMAIRGGSWYDGETAGMFHLYTRDSRKFIFPDIGFRCAFVEI